jgi:hypothetical protein
MVVVNAEMPSGNAEPFFADASSCRLAIENEVLSTTHEHIRPEYIHQILTRCKAFNLQDERVERITRLD